MYAVLAEDRSDVDTLKAIIARLHPKAKSPTILGKGYDGCNEMFRKGALDLRNFARRACNRFVVCYDSDQDDPAKRHRRVIDEIVKPSGIRDPICVLVPVQEIEAWILADLDSVQAVIKGWRAKKAIPNPENIKDPKEYLVRLSKENGRPLYSYATHNPVVAKSLNLEIVHGKCPSFRPLAALVRNGAGNFQASR